MIHLDTSFLILALAPGSPENRRLQEWVDTGETLSMSAVGWAEFLCGPLDTADLEFATQVIGRPDDFTEDHAVTAARLFNEAGRRRGTFADCMIAAAALSEGAPIATANPADFAPFEALGLRLA